MFSDFPITFSLVVLGLIIVPDPLYKRKTWWRTEKERQMCMKHLEANDRQQLGDLLLFVSLLIRL
ncbi:unnamed protein product [Clonostachys rosea f. rosea IK726]|uniref:Uncharacterized protein n=2 Tax=Bionectria ochroleuca TaxID=29856 RepID=A0A0B7KC34_BIOOC|nr:unnamed protein product [Clonostachys rosea f. rosea IK726]